MKRILYFLIVLISLAGCRSDSDITSPDDGVPPAIPAGIVITFANDGEIIIEWEPNKEPDWKSYHIYRSLDSISYTRIATLGSEFYLDDSLEYEQQYFYKLSAEDYSGRESNLSSEVSAVPVNIYPPDKPQYLSINARNYEYHLSVYLDWYPGYESDIIGYNIYRSENESFTADSSTLVGFTPVINFSDTAGLELYTRYYYKIRGVDRGQLIGKESDIVTDMIVGIPEVFYPPDNSYLNPFPEFIIKAVDVPAVYRIIVLTNEFFGEFWSTSINTSVTNDTLHIPFTPLYLESNKKYYWRTAVYTLEEDPNSISPKYTFTIKPE